MRATTALLVTLLGACASHRLSSPSPARAEPAEVLFDLAMTCPRIAIDRGARQFLAAVTERPEELGITSATPSALVVGRRAAQGAALVWHHDLGPDTTSFELSEGRLGEGIAIAGVATAPIPFVHADARPRWKGLFVVSFAPDGALRFSRWIEAGPGSPLSSAAPHITAVVTGPRSEVTLAGTTNEPLDFGGVTLPVDEDAHDRTIAFVVQYTSTGNLAFATSRPAKLGTSPQLVARPDGGLVMGFGARDGSSHLEAFEPTEPRGVGHRLPVTLEGALKGLAAAGAHDVVATTNARQEGEPSLVLRIARVAATGEVLWSRTMQGELQTGALAVTTAGTTWFTGWFEGYPADCVSVPLEAGHESTLPRLQLIEPSGTRCRSLPTSTRTAQWSTPASLLETAPGRMTFAAPLAGTATLSGIRAEATPLAVRCVAVTLPTEAPEYRP